MIHTQATLKASTERRGTCWVWVGSVDKDGYGKVWHDGKEYRAHRLAYELAKEAPGKLWVLHSCDNPSCIRPSHLWLGTNQDNTADRERKGRGPQKEQHPLWGRKGVDNPRFGKKHTEEARQKIGDAQRGEKNHMYGTNHSDAHKAKISAGLRRFYGSNK